MACWTGVDTGPPCSASRAPLAGRTSGPSTCGMTRRKARTASAASTACMADCSNFNGAEKLADLLGALLGVKVVQP